MKKEFQLTRQGVEELQAELADLVASRLDVAERLKIARDHGDLRENAEYHNARDEQAALETRVAEIESILRSVEIVKEGKSKDCVALGSKVVLKANSGEQTFTVVGSIEADPADRKISDASPIGQALMGRKVGDTVEINLPSGNVTYKIKSIS